MGDEVRVICVCVNCGHQWTGAGNVKQLESRVGELEGVLQKLVDYYVEPDTWAYETIMDALYPEGWDR